MGGGSCTRELKCCCSSFAGCTGRVQFSSVAAKGQKKKPKLHQKCLAQDWVSGRRRRRA